MPACFTPLQEAAVVPLTGCQSRGLWFWKGHQQDSCSLHRNPKDGNLDLVGGHVFFDSGRFHLLPSHTAPCKDKGFSSSERWSLQEEIKLPDTKKGQLGTEAVSVLFRTVEYVNWSAWTAVNLVSRFPASLPGHMLTGSCAALLHWFSPGTGARTITQWDR